MDEKIYGITLRNGETYTIFAESELKTIIQSIMRGGFINFRHNGKWVLHNGDVPTDLNQISIRADEIIAVSHKEDLE